jgi:hypothetical protein
MPAIASQRYAAPTPTGSMNCSSPENACGIEAAIGSASNGDEVIVEPGGYGTAATPLTSIIESGATGLNVHGVDATPGPPSARVFTAGAYGIELYGPGSTLSDLDIEDSGSSFGAALLLEGAVGERLIVHAGENESRACSLQGTTTLRDSICRADGSGRAISVNAVLSGPNNVTVRNVTAIAGGLGIEAVSLSARSTTVNLVNTILRGGLFDISASQATEPASVSSSHSNYQTTRALGGATISDDGSSQTAGDQSLTQLFVEPAGGDFREALGAQTIDTGADNALNGPVDICGVPRQVGLHTDIGAYEWLAPSAVTGAANGVGQTTATLNGLVNPNGVPTTYRFIYGTTVAYGNATMVTSAGSGNSASGVSATVSGLAPGTTYHYQLVASGCDGSGSGIDGTFSTASAPSGSTTPVAVAPSVTQLRQSASRWRAGNTLARIDSRRRRPKSNLPIGTTFSFSLNQRAAVTFTFTQQVTGRRVGHNCVGKRRRNTGKRGCVRTVMAGTLSFTGRSATNTVAFQGRISRSMQLRPGRYTVVVVATNAAGQRSSPERLTFTIVR